MRCRKTEAVYVTFVGSGLSMPEIARVGCACSVIAWNAVRVTRASPDKQPHDVAAIFDAVTISPPRSAAPAGGRWRGAT